jgi:uncharacterized coiled-coil protein SlyX
VAKQTKVLMDEALSEALTEANRVLGKLTAEVNALTDERDFLRRLLLQLTAERRPC